MPGMSEKYLVYRIFRFEDKTDVEHDFAVISAGPEEEVRESRKYGNFVCVEVREL